MNNNNLSNWKFKLESDVRIVLLFVAFSLLIIASLVMMLWNNNKVESRIDRSVKTTTEVINSSKDCIAETSVAQRMLLNLAIITDPRERGILEQTLIKAQTNNENSFYNLKSHFSQEQGSSMELIRSAEKSKEEYIAAAKNFFVLTQSNNRDEISDYLLSELKPKYEMYQTNQQQIFQVLSKNLVEQTGDITESSNTFAWILFSLGVFPFVFLIGKMFYALLTTRISA